jgi:hypothetical protein
LVPLPPITLVVLTGTPTGRGAATEGAASQTPPAPGGLVGDGPTRGDTIRRLALLAAVALIWVLLSGWLLLSLRRWRA